MNAVTWPQIRNLMQMLMSASGGYLAAKYPSIDWPLIGAIVLNLAAIGWTIKSGTVATVVTDAAQLKSSSGANVLEPMTVNPKNPEAKELVMATPNNVTMGPGATNSAGFKSGPGIV